VQEVLGNARVLGEKLRDSRVFDHYELTTDRL
jgi:hypothetical protein